MSPADQPNNAKKNGPAMTTLFLLPFAGGSIYSYRPFEEAPVPGVQLHPLELPGRGRRVSEPLLSTMEEAVDDVTGQLKAAADGNFALFGHSMGAILAYLSTLKLAREGAPLPGRLFLSGHRAPTCPQRTRTKHDLPREELIEELRKLQGVPEPLLQDPEAMDFFEPVLRSDFRIIEHFCQPEPDPVPIPIHLFMGKEDDITEPEKLKWKYNTGDAFSITEFNGGHFFIYDYVISISEIISSHLNT